MPGINPKSPSQRPFRLANHGFQSLNATKDNMEDRTADIPLQTVVSHTTTDVEKAEKKGVFSHGRRKLVPIDSKTGAPLPPRANEEEKTALNKMGRFYTKILNFSIVTRYMIYVAPIALFLAIPIILSQTGVIHGTISGTDQRRFWIWIEVVWLSFWAMKIAARFLPDLFEFLVGVVSPGVKKYALLLRAVEQPFSFVLWMIVNQATFPVLVIVVKTREKPNPPKPQWYVTMQSVLLALLVCTIVILSERVLVQLISISYHRKQFDAKIKESKRNIYLLGILYEASRELFPAYCNEFAEEDYIIQDTILDLGLDKRNHKSKHGRSGSRTPLRLIQEVGRDAGRIGDKITSVFGTIASEITGKKVFNPNSAHSIVLTALEHRASCEALARRIWMSFVVDGKNELYEEDLIEVMGPNRQEEAVECFAAIDKDGNGDISLDEMTFTVKEYAKERRSINSSMHDVDQAINALDALLLTITLIICLFVFIAFLAPSFRATLTTSATALLSLSFVFAVTAQEVLGSCIFLFVKHPYDIGDRVDIGTEQLVVEHIALLYSVFKRVTTGKTVQIPHIVLNTLWIENVTRSKCMKEQISVFCAFDTSFDDIHLLKQEMLAFVRDPINARDFQHDLDIDVTSIAEMNKLELRIEIRHKSNWSNESLRTIRRSKFMCALVLALRKVPIYGPGGSDATLGSSDRPSWSVAIPADDAVAAYNAYKEKTDAKRMVPLNQPSIPGNDQAKSTSLDLFSSATETQAASALNNRKPIVDTFRGEAWSTRDDVSTLGRPSLDGRGDVDEVRNVLRKASFAGKRKEGATLSPTFPRPSGDSSGPSFGAQLPPPPGPPPPGPLPQVLAGSLSNNFPSPPSFIPTGYGEEYKYQTGAPPPQSQNRPRAPTVGDDGDRRWEISMDGRSQAQGQSQGTNNPYRYSLSQPGPAPRLQYKRE